MRIDFICLLLLFGSPICVALQEPELYDPAQAAERELLLRWVTELDASRALIRGANEQASGSVRLRFDYSRFARDLDLVREGVLAYVNEHEASWRQGDSLAQILGSYDRGEP